MVRRSTRGANDGCLYRRRGQRCQRPRGLRALAYPGGPDHRAVRGKILAAASAEQVEGEWQPLAIMIIVFPTMDDLRQCYASVVEHPELRELRQRAVVGDVVFVDGA